jgi:hypothetical protein
MQSKMQTKDKSRLALVLSSGVSIRRIICIYSTRLSSSIRAAEEATGKGESFGNE